MAFLTSRSVAIFLLVLSGLQLVCTLERHPSNEQSMGMDCPYASSKTNPQDKETLEDLYYNMGGAVWVRKDAWMQGDPCGDVWFGICCSNEGRVTELKLPSNLVVGQLTSAIARLSELQVLILFNNSIEGIVPPELFTMKKLQKLDLSYNFLTAAIPEKISLPQITNLTLSGNRLLGYLPSEWNTPNLKYLLLSSNSFQGEIPDSIGTLSNILEIDLSNNYFSNLTVAFGKLKSLEKLSLTEITTLANANIPNEWSGMSNLKELSVNYLSGNLPEWIGESWSEMVKLSLTIGQISGTIPPSICKLKMINYLDLLDNQMSGEIPKCICDLPSKTFTQLRLSENQFTGIIPDCFENLHNLTYFDISSNKLHGYLPRSLGSLPKLISISLSGNNLYGQVPTEYAKLENTIQSFEISRNKINSVEDGLEPFFKAFQNSASSCFLYGNPWTCPLPAYVTTVCNIECSKCNTPDKHNSCTACVADSQCGWCGEGGNCLPGSIAGPDPYSYSCKNESWIYEFQAQCMN